ncbi:hypothetical protein AB1N83_010285 [Pleurotus pulmonarius]
MFFHGPRRFLLETASQTQNAWRNLNKQGKTSSILGASHASDSSEWFGSHGVMETFAVDAMINFINTFDPNVRANPLAPKSSLFWPRWQEFTGVPLLVFSDPSKLSISNDTFLRARAQPGGVSSIFARGTMIDHIMSLLSTSTSVWFDKIFCSRREVACANIVFRLRYS